MMEIELTDAGKRYNRDWIFRNWSVQLSAPHACVITGSNGSGKSTALRSLLGFTPLSEGTLAYRSKGRQVKREEIYNYISICAPYLELYEELTLEETAKFHFSLKPILSGVSESAFASLIGLEHSRNKAVKNFSSGMKQRLKLGLALLSDTQMVLLDEPTSNLDLRGREWYVEMVNTFRRDRLFIVASNNLAEEYAFCEKQIHIEDFKPR